MARGILVVIEGIDGSGKTTVANAVVRALNSFGYRAVYTREPTSSKFFEAFEEYIEEFGCDPLIEVLAMAIDRAYHVTRIIMPLLERGFIVVTDRYIYSSIAYQSVVGASIDWIKAVNSFVPMPDIAIYLDVPLDVALNRIRNRSSHRLKHFEFVNRLSKVVEVYRKLVAEGLMIAIDATDSIEIVTQRCLDIVLRVVEGRHR